MEEDRKKFDYKKILVFFMLVLADAATAAAGLFWYKLSDLQVIRLMAFILAAELFVAFSFRCSDYYRTLFAKNMSGYMHFFTAFVLLMLCALVFPVMPIASWPFAVVFVLLTLTSNVPTGIMASSVCLVISASMSGMDNISYYLAYFLCGMIASLVLANITEEFKIGLPMVITEAVLISSLVVVSVTTESVISVELMIYPVINAAITLLLILLVLKVYAAKVIFSEKDKYLEINDPECQVLAELKSCSADDYYKSVHVAYFCDRIAKKLGLDDNAVKCAGLYHRIGIIKGQRSWQNTNEVCREQKLPENVCDTLAQFLDSSRKIESPEAAVLFMSECIVSSVKYLFDKNKDISLDYPSLINAIFKQRVEAGIFEKCSISIEQFEKMKTVFIEEKLYYDFLR